MYISTRGEKTSAIIGKAKIRNKRDYNDSTTDMNMSYQPVMRSIAEFLKGQSFLINGYLPR